MCGLVGMVGEMNVQHEKCMRTLLILDSIRGEDSTGIAVVGKHSDQIKMAKQVGDPFQLFDHKSYDKTMVGTQRAMIGHNRYATSGAVRRETAHPFENDSYVGVHNGTLRNKWKLADANQYVVDSENLYHHMHKHGLENLLDTMDGAWALVWWNKRENTINFLRNKERPLYMAYSDDGKVLYWASEHWMLFAALNKHALNYDKIEMMPQDLHISIRIAPNGTLAKPHAVEAPSTYVATVYPQQQQPLNNRPPVINTTKPTQAATNVVAITQNTSTVVKEEQAAATVKKPVEVQNGVLHSRYDLFYINAIKRKLELLNITKDKDGERYISCFDPQYDAYEIRLYAPDNHMVWEMIGEDIIGDILSYGALGTLSGRGFYRVDPANFRVVVPEIVPEHQEETMTDPLGRKITKSMFEQTYKTCEYCSCNLSFYQRNRFTTSGQCFCPDCATLADVVDNVKFQ